jgi:hypothetical protein
MLQQVHERRIAKSDFPQFPDVEQIRTTDEKG